MIQYEQLEVEVAGGPQMLLTGNVQSVCITTSDTQELWTADIDALFHFTR